MPRTPNATDEEELGELPPLDGEVDDDFEPEIELDGEEGSMPVDDGAGPENDADLDEIDLDESERSWLSEQPDSEDLDVGAAALCDIGSEISLLSESEEGEGPSDADLPGDSSEDVELDGGEEGPLAPDDELRDEDLPALDADADGEFDDAAFMDERFSSEEPLGLPWATKPWLRVGAPLDLASATAVACVPRGALVASCAESGSPEISRVDLEGARETLVADGATHVPLVKIAAEAHEIAGVASDGRLVVSRDGGSRFELAAPGVVVSDALYASRALWLRTGLGALLVSADGGRSFARCRVLGGIAAITRDASATLVALVVDDAERAVALVRATNADPALVREPIEGPHVGAPTILAARDGHVAYAGPSAVARRAPGTPWQSFAWEGRVTALTFVDDVGTLLAATYFAGDDTTGLICLDAAGRASVVARLGAAPRQEEDERIVHRGDGRVLALACDDARGVIWAVGDFGVAAFAIATPGTEG